MNFDPASFANVLVVDTCSVWHVLTSRLLFEAAVTTKKKFSITSMVLFECMHKPPGSLPPEEAELRRRFISARSRGVFSERACTLSDLIKISDRAPKKLGYGELSCMAVLASSPGEAMMTDDKAARRYASEVLGYSIETTPRLYAHLHFRRLLTDSDHLSVKAEHEIYEKRPLSEFLDAAYEHACMCRLRSGTS